MQLIGKPKRKGYHKLDYGHIEKILHLVFIQYRIFLILLVNVIYHNLLDLIRTLHLPFNSTISNFKSTMLPENDDMEFLLDWGTQDIKSTNPRVVVWGT